MGLKYVENMKSLILLLLILLSISLTFSIWTYTPSYDPIEKQPVVDITIAEKKKIEDVVMPYKIMFNFEEGHTGTTDPFEAERLIDNMKSWKVEELTLSRRNMSISDMNELLRKPNQFVFFYQAGVPFRVFDSILPIEESSIPQDSFTKLIVDWNNVEGQTVRFYFLNENEKQLHVAIARGVDRSTFENRVVLNAREYPSYTEVERENQRSLYVTLEPVNVLSNTYLLEETNPNRFKEALFNDPNVVRSSMVTSNIEEYQDATSMMTVDREGNWIQFVNTSAESSGVAIPADLVLDSVDFINEHGGWTDDYRYSYINPINQEIKFQLYDSGLPVFSESRFLKTEITQKWGNGQLFQYQRPYYDLGYNLPTESEEAPLPSGKSVTEILEKIREIDFNTIDEIMVGYLMIKEQRLLIMKPAYFYSINGKWSHISQEMLGGGPLGLE